MSRKRPHSRVRRHRGTAAGEPARFSGIGRRPSLWSIPRPDWACLGILLVVTLGFFWKGFVDPGEMIREDAAYFYQPAYTYATQEISSGRFPHWNPYVSSGGPFHAEAQSAALYPFRLMLGGFSYPVGYALMLWIHFFLTGAFAYLFIRVTLRCGAVPSLIGAVSVSFGGFALSHVTHPNWVQAYPWVVLTVFLLAEAMRRSSWTFAVSAAVPVSLVLLACAVHLLLVMTVGLGVWAAGETIARIIAGIRGRSKSLLRILEPGAMIAVALVLAGAIGMVQLWPTLAQTERSLRTGSEWKFITEFCSHPLRASFRMVVPFYYGNYRLGYWGENNFHGQCFYAGIVPLFAAVMAVVLCWRNPWVRRLLIFIAIVATIAAGRFLPFYRILYDRVPMFAKLRNPARFFYWVQFAVACLGAIALDARLRARRDGGAKRTWIAPAIVGLVLGAVMVGALVKIQRLAKDPSPGLEFVEKLDRISDLDRRRAAEAVTTMPQRFIAQKDPVTWIGVAAGLLSICACSVFFASSCPRRPILRWVLLGLLILDLGMLSAGMLYYLERDSSEISVAVTETPEHVRFLQENLGRHRYLCKGWDRTNLDRMRGTQFRLRHAVTNNAGIFHTPRQWEIVRQVWGKNRRVADLVGTKYVVTNVPWRGGNLRPAYQKEPVYITENLQAFPRAFLAREVHVLEDPNAVFAEVAGGRRNLRDVALLEEPVPPLPRDPSDGPPGRVSITGDLPGRYRMHISAPGWRQLVLTETHHPQWKCTIDGKTVPVYLTDYAFMSVRVPPGEHEVLWWFEPTRFKQGLIVSLVALGLTFGTLGFSLFRLLRRRSAPAGGAHRSRAGARVGVAGRPTFETAG